MPTQNRVNGKRVTKVAQPASPSPASSATGAGNREDNRGKAFRSGPSRRPKLGQNFLADPGAAEKIVAALGNISQATVLEIGPGRGALTDLLAKQAGQLIGVELDRVLAAQLRMKYAGRSNVEIIEGDILSVDLGALLSSRRGVWGDPAPAPIRRVRVVGNIPYYITSDIVLRLLEYHPQIESIVILLQQEVAERLAAKPGNREYGLLSATTQLYAKVEKLFTLPPGAFVPPPKVHSTAVRLTMAPQGERLRVPEGEFVDFLKLSFAQKRKTLLNNLKSRYPEPILTRALSRAAVRRDVRAEALPLEKAAAIFRHLSEKELS